MVQTVRNPHPRTPNFRCGTGHRYRKNAENVLFTGIFCYTNPCIKNTVIRNFRTTAADGKTITQRTIKEINTIVQVETVKIKVETMAKKAHIPYCI